MKIVFLDAATMGDASMAEIAALGEFVCYPSSTAEEARARAADADVVLLNKVIVDQAFLDACPKLKLVCEAGTGINNIDVNLCDARGVIVRNVAGYSTESVAQTAWMHILALAGRAFHYNAYAKDGRYSAGSTRRTAVTAPAASMSMRTIPSPRSSARPSASSEWAPSARKSPPSARPSA